MGIKLYSLFFISFFWCTFSVAMNHASGDFLDKIILSKSCESARLSIPEIIKRNTLSNLEKEPTINLQKSIDSVKPLCPIDPFLQKELETLCSKVKHLFLQEAPSENFFDMHQRLKTLILVPTYCTFTLYKIYREALEKAYQKAERLKISRHNEVMATLIFEESRKTREKTQTLALTSPI